MSRTESRRPPDHISLIAPVRDEEESIGPLLDAVLEQSRRPAEVVITDGGSADRTREIVRRYQETYPIPLLLIEDENALPGRGRNLAIARASHEWVACIDAGIVPHRNWLQGLVAAAETEPDAEVIYGCCEPVTDTYFKECAAIAYVPAGPRTRFIVSSLFRRSAWEAAGGFREDLRSGEDILFFEALDKSGARAAYTPDAVVHWALQASPAGTYRRFRSYSRHNIRAGLFAQWQLRVSIYYLLMLSFLLAGLFWWPLALAALLIPLVRAERQIYRWYARKDTRRQRAELLNPRRVLTVTGILLLVDLATFHGMFDWVVRDCLQGSAEKSGHAPGATGHHRG